MALEGEVVPVMGSIDTERETNMFVMSRLISAV